MDDVTISGIRAIANHVPVPRIFFWKFFFFWKTRWLCAKPWTARGVDICELLEALLSEYLDQSEQP